MLQALEYILARRMPDVIGLATITHLLRLSRSFQVGISGHIDTRIHIPREPEKRSALRITRVPVCSICGQRDCQWRNTGGGTGDV